VPLSIIKADARLKEMELIKYGRLSVQSVKPEEWDIVLELAGE
jgi:predicted RNA-binding protein with PUA-like domain